MNVIEFPAFRKWKDEELVEVTCRKMARLKSLLEKENNEEYWEEVMIINSMIIEIKKRNLKINEEKLIENILKK
ncbi:MAG TPA: hypothetical protein GXX63_00370 [Tissierellia bacterium]|nr:hypothetical protein [Tissierellia bacterium]